MTLDTHNFNKAIIPTNHPIPQSKQNLQNENGFQKWTLNLHFGKWNYMNHQET